jgi:hypothetical protein
MAVINFEIIRVYSPPPHVADIFAGMAGNFSQQLATVTRVVLPISLYYLSQGMRAPWGCLAKFYPNVFMSLEAGESFLSDSALLG